MTPGSARATAAITASRSRASRTTGSAPRERSSAPFASERVVPSTSWPWATSLGTRWRPRAPVAPTRKTFMLAPFKTFAFPDEMATSAVTDLRPLMLSVAYRMVGSVSEAEDIVQEAFLRFHRATQSGEAIESPRAWLSAATTRLSIDHPRSARVRRESYVGPWLPEPLLADPAPDASRH